jgi:hypothetical protein
MEDLYILTYLCEDGSESEKSFTAETVEEAKQLALSVVAGGEGLLSCIWLSDGMTQWELDYSDCEWHPEECYPIDDPRLDFVCPF